MLPFNIAHGACNPFWTGIPPPDDDTLIGAAQQIVRRAVGLVETPPTSRARRHALAPAIPADADASAPGLVRAEAPHVALAVLGHEVS